MNTEAHPSPAPLHSAPKRRRRRPQLPLATHNDLMRIYAASGPRRTKKATRELLAAGGYEATPEALVHFIQLPTFVANQRASRTARRFETRFGKPPSSVQMRRSRVYEDEPEPRPVRLQRIRIRAVAKAARAAFRHGAAGGGSFRVAFAKSTADVKYEVTIGSNRSTYKGAYKGWSATEDHHLICVPTDWRVRVQKRGMECLGGLMTLDLHALPAPRGVQLFAAVWASQGRGYTVTTHRGYIAVCWDEHFHAETAEAAVKGLSRRLSALGEPGLAPGMGLDVEAFVKRYEKHAAVMVSIDHARKTGSCEYGILSWCASVGIDPALYEVPLKVVLEGFRQRPQVEVRRAVLQAVREHSER